jgi:PBP1b-binding outer membrane lipoprotein LpoB
MKIFLKLLMISLIGVFLVGCTATNESVEKPQMKTSKQVEKELNWRYCEESK